ncbi:MAG TPA: HU family DNA-binding protein [Bacillota bacterium]|jgi:DNA-binding protein HU-beta|nr:HU family DNA-binding protein [Bacillota bacterium]HNU94380.1 HU family DNA-binding protein [Bacillota bacterium]
MTKSDLVDSVAAKAGMTKKDSARAVDAVFDTIKEQLKAGDKVQLVGFGSFEVKQREARVGRNPKTMDEIRIPARRVPVFRPGKELKESVM